MEIRFSKRKLQRCCSEEALLLKTFGTINGQIIKRRLVALEAYPTLADVPTLRPERCHILVGDRSGCFAIDVQHPFRIVFLPDHDPLPRVRGGDLNLRAVTAICIVEITDYH